MATYTSDTFTGTDGSAVSSAWSSGYTGSSSPSFTVQGNKGRLKSGTGTGYVYNQKGICRPCNYADQADGRISFSYVGSTECYPEIVFRCVSTTFDGASGIYVRLPVPGGDSVIKLSEISSYSTVISQTASFTPSSGVEYKVKIEAEGSTIRAKIWAASGGEPGSWTATLTGVSRTSAGKSGINLSPGNVSASYIDLDNWLFESMSTTHEASGVLALVTGLSGSAQRERNAIGNLNPAVLLGGSLRTDRNAMGALAVATALSGAGTRERNAAGNVGETIALAGIGQRERNVTGLLAETVGLTGSTSSELAANGLLSISIGLSGTATRERNATGSRGLSASLAGSAVRERNASGSLYITTTLAGQTVDEGSVSGPLAAVISMTGTATVDRSSTGSLSLLVANGGSATRQVYITGLLSLTGVLTGGSALPSAPPGRLSARPRGRAQGRTRSVKHARIIGRQS